MNTRKIRNLAFSFHRYIGLAVGLILVIVGLTGSLLVFNQEINAALVKRKYDRVIPQQQTLSLDVITNSVKDNYANQPDYKIHQFDLHFDPNIYKVRLKNSADKQLEVFVNALVFLAMISISGFCWNFYEQTEPVCWFVSHCFIYYWLDYVSAASSSSSCCQD